MHRRGTSVKIYRLLLVILAVIYSGLNAKPENAIPITDTSTLFQLGTAKVEMNVFVEGLGMLGYGDAKQKMLSQSTPLYVRAYYIADINHTKSLYLVSCDLCFITYSLRRQVLERFNELAPQYNLKSEQFVLLATHTHAGPAGYDHYPVYNLPVPGYREATLDSITEAVCRSMLLARQNLCEAKLEYLSGMVNDSIPLAFNRSLKAYNKNIDIVPVSQAEAYKAVDRKMQLLCMQSHGDIVALCSWFGVHPTCFGQYNTALSYENMGYAAEMAEIHLAGKTHNAVCSFLQSSAGDVSPYWLTDGEKRRPKANFAESIAFSENNGRMLYEAGFEILHQGGGNRVLQAKIDYCLVYVDMGNVIVDTARNIRTAPPSLGMSFLAGTKNEGGGISPVVVFMGNRMADAAMGYHLMMQVFRTKETRRLVKTMHRMHYPKKRIIGGGYRRLIGARRVDKVILPGFIDPTIDEFKKQYRKRSLDTLTWSPQIVPLQIIQIGCLGIIAFPAEITTTAAKRLSNSLQRILAAKGISEIIISSYANDYSGYVTTPEEYTAQCYEGGHTLYGKYTLDAYILKYCQLAEDFAADSTSDRFNRELLPPVFPDYVLQRRAYAPAQYKTYPNLP